MSGLDAPPGWDRGDSAAVARVLDRCDVLGPGRRAVVWVQGCPLRCQGCASPDTLAFRSDRVSSVDVLAARLAAIGDIEGVSLSGGEPFSQPRSLARLLDLIRARRPELSAMAYSGSTLAELRAAGPAAGALLDRLDILVDGSYKQGLHADLRWRGSSNQTVHHLTDRYAHLAAGPDRSAGVEVHVTSAGSLLWAGIPPRPGYRPGLEREMSTRGVVLNRRMST